METHDTISGSCPNLPETRDELHIAEITLVTDLLKAAAGRWRVGALGRCASDSHAAA